MIDRLKNIEERAKVWLEANADSASAQTLLGVISFLEASILPLPPSTILVGMAALGKKSRWFYLALLTTVTSVLGGLFGYLLGSVLYDSIGKVIIEKYGFVDELARVGELFANNAFFANFVAAFTPIPYKVFTIGSGFFDINPLSFVAASFLGRGLRFFVVAYLAEVFGEHVAKRLFKYAALTTLVMVAVIVLLAIWFSV